MKSVISRTWFGAVMVFSVGALGAVPPVEAQPTPSMSTVQTPGSYATTQVKPNLQKSRRGVRQSTVLTKKSRRPTARRSVDVTPPRIDRLTPAPGIWIVDNIGVPEIQIGFTEPIATPIPAGAITIWTVGGGAVTNFTTSYDGVTDILTVSFASPVRDDRLTIVVDYSITDVVGNELDGEIADPLSAVLPSGDGVRGGQAVFRINILQGDANRDGVVDATGGPDSIIIRDALPSVVGDDRFDSRADLNVDGVVNAKDVGIFRLAEGRTLPATDGVSPIVTAVTPNPVDGILGDFDTVRIDFGESVQPAGVNERTCFLVDAGGNVVVAAFVGVSALADSADYFFVPALPQCGTYTINISNALADQSGELLASPTVPPMVTGLIPPPAPTLNAHTTMTTANMVTISGSAPGAASVEVSCPTGVFTVPLTNDAFTADITLSIDTKNQIFFTALSTCSGVRSPPIMTSVTHDTVPPEIFIDFPLDGAQITTATTDVAGRVGDVLSGFMGLTVTINGSPAIVDVGVGNNGTFFAPNVPLGPIDQPTIITAIATDELGNTISKQISATRIGLTPSTSQMTVFSGNSQSGQVLTALPAPIVVQIFDTDGVTPFVNKVVTFKVTRSDGRLGTSAASITPITDPNNPNYNPDPGVMMYQVRTDAIGKAQVYWRMGHDAGCGNNRVEATSTSIEGTVAFCASAGANSPTQLNIGTGNNQRAEAGGPAPGPLNAWVSDGQNGKCGVQVTFTITQGGGIVTGNTSPLQCSASDPVIAPTFVSGQTATVYTDLTGHAAIGFTLGPNQGNNVVDATLVSNSMLIPATFVTFGVLRNEAVPTSFTGLVLNNAMQPIGGATCVLTVGSQAFTAMPTDVSGRFNFDQDALGMPQSILSGPARLKIDGSAATTVNGLTIPLGKYPSLPFEPVIIPNVVNTLPAPILLPPLESTGGKLFNGSQDVILTLDDVDGLEMLIRANTTVTKTDGSVVDAINPITLILSQVHADDIPMPIPDGASPPFAWTLQPGGTHFDPPIEITYPNMSGLPAGSIAYFLSFDHALSRFGIVASGHVTDDGSQIISDPGAGLAVAGWGCNCPPYSVSGDCCCGANDVCCDGPCCCGNCCPVGGSCCNEQCCAGPCCSGTCCPAGNTCCNGMCCDGMCIDGVCCDGLECGGQCCTGSESCCGGQCCDGPCCNGVCCPEGGTCCGDVCCPGLCCDGVCCGPKDKSCCDNKCCAGPCCEATGMCCASDDESCCNDMCCGGPCCNDVCSPEGTVDCGSGCCPKDFECCDSTGDLCCPDGKACCDTKCCPEGWTCCNGECCPGPCCENTGECCASADKSCCDDMCCGGPCCDATGECCPSTDETCCNNECCVGPCCKGTCCTQSGGECCSTSPSGCCAANERCCETTGGGCCPKNTTCCGEEDCCGVGIVCCDGGCCPTGEDCCGGDTCCEADKCCDTECCADNETCCNGVCELGSCSILVPPGEGCPGSNVTLTLTGDCDPDCDMMSFSLTNSVQYLSVNLPSSMSCAGPSQDIIFTVDIDPSAPTGPIVFEIVGKTDATECSTMVTVTVKNVDLIFDGQPETMEETPGGVICVNNDDDDNSVVADKDDDPGTVQLDDDLKKLELKLNGLPAGGMGTLTLSQQGSVEVRLYDNDFQNRTNPVSLSQPLMFSGSDLPKTFYVEGFKASTFPRDVKFEFEYTIPGGDTCKDTVKLSVAGIEFIDNSQEYGVGSVYRKQDLVGIVAVFPTVTFDSVNTLVLPATDGIGPVTTGVVRGKVTDFIAPLRPGDLTLNGFPVTLATHSSSLPYGPFVQSFESSILLNDYDELIRVDGRNALGNVGTDKIVVDAIYDTSTGAFQSRSYSEMSNTPGSRSNPLFRLEVHDMLRASNSMTVMVDAGIGTPQMIPLTRVGSIFQSQELCLVPSTVDLSGAPQEVIGTRIRVELGKKIKVNFTATNGPICEDNAIVIGTMLVDPVSQNPLEVVRAGLARDVELNTTDNNILALVGAPGDLPNLMLDNGVPYLDAILSPYTYKNGVSPLTQEPGYTPAQSRLLQASPDKLQPDYNLFRTDAANAILPMSSKSAMWQAGESRTLVDVEAGGFLRLDVATDVGQFQSVEPVRGEMVVAVLVDGLGAGFPQNFFPGQPPENLETMMAKPAGDPLSLPNFKKLIDDAQAKRIRYDGHTTFPSITYSAWSSWVTGEDPKDHGVTGSNFYRRSVPATDPFWCGANPDPSCALGPFPLPGMQSPIDMVTFLSPTDGVFDIDVSNVWSSIGTLNSAIRKRTHTPSITTIYERLDDIGLLSAVVYHFPFRGATESSFPSEFSGLEQHADGSGKLLDLGTSLELEKLMGLTASTHIRPPQLLTAYYAGYDTHIHNDPTYPAGGTATGHLAYTDKHVGTLIRLLDQWNLLDSAVFTFTGDHGLSSVFNNDLHSMVLEDFLDLELEQIMIAAGFDPLDFAAEIDHDAVIALNGGMAHIYVRNRDPGVNTWSALPLYSDVLTMAERFYNNSIPVAQGGIVDDPEGSYVGAFDLILVRNPAGGFNGPYKVLVKQGGVFSTVTLSAAESSGLVDSRYVDIQTNFQRLQDVRSGDVIILSAGLCDNNATGYYFGAPLPGWHGGLCASDMTIPIIFSLPNGNAIALNRFGVIVDDPLLGLPLPPSEARITGIHQTIYELLTREIP